MFKSNCILFTLFVLSSSGADIPSEVFIKEACEGSELTLKCDRGLIEIISANYGRTVQTTCVRGPIRDNNCRSQNSLSIVSNSCSGQTICKIKSSNEVFGDPCLNTYKYLTVTYTCRDKCLDSGHNTIFTKTSCEGEVLYIDCSHKIIDVVDAQYGRTNSEQCAYGPIKTTSCSATNTKSVVKNVCTGRKNCAVGSSNGNFGDPCLGTYKYLTVSYKCLNFKDCDNLIPQSN
ncbi:L-rhamnose-binding lectin CSL3 [Aethina tumida]|uniref:L-rhamnose-binding lectin CSL3 n=1 Tax=Aethina tumida TaxID=116153 RepID=UPI0021494D7B|nr:L-rhamnose-binding lectin CSL3 [Aethina tumida]